MSAPDIRAELESLEARLQALGYRMELDAGAIPGEGHVLLMLDGSDPNEEDVPAEVTDLARAWSDLTDQAIEESDDSDMRRRP